MIVEKKSQGFYVRVDQYDALSGWVSVKGTSHRNWKVRLAPEIELWLKRNTSWCRIRDEFMHDDYPCYFSFTFLYEREADKFIDYMRKEWPR